MDITVERVPARLVREFAAAAHAIWCQQLKQSGWRHGAEFDEEAKTDPRLVPFDELSAFDRDHLCDRNAWQESMEGAVDDVDFTLRLAAEELRADDIAEGTRVRLVPGNVQTPTDEDWEGQVVAWKETRLKSGRLESISVRWHDDSVAKYQPHELEVVEDE